MPLIKIQTSTPAPTAATVTALLQKLSQDLSQHLGKPESYVMTAFESNVPMTFAGTTDPTCYVEIKSVGTINAHQSRAMSQDFCQQLGAALGIPANRIYIEFAEAKGSLWGWNGSTFG
jgi:phenylpyruvate tautomerase PptA (4-oxalocrotonate tautomerase family)